MNMRKTTKNRSALFFRKFVMSISMAADPMKKGCQRCDSLVNTFD